MSNHPLLYLVALEPEPGHEETFNEWYNTEHVPELLACPGFRSARRFELIEDVTKAPRYLAIYEVDNLDAFRSPEYLALKRRTSEDLTPLARASAAHRTRALAGRYRELNIGC